MDSVHVLQTFICVFTYTHTYIHQGKHQERENFQIMGYTLSQKAHRHTKDNATDSREFLSLRGNIQIRVSTCYARTISFTKKCLKSLPCYL